MHQDLFTLNKTTVEEVFNLISESARKLTIISTVFDEEEVVVVAFQDYVASIKDLLALGDTVNRTETELQLRLQLTKLAKELAGSIKEINSEMRKLFEARERLTQFGKSVEKSLALAEKLNLLILRCANLEASTLETRRLSDPLPSPRPTDDGLNNDVQSTTSSVPLLQSARRFFQRNSSLRKKGRGGGGESEGNSSETEDFEPVVNQPYLPLKQFIGTKSTPDMPRSDEDKLERSIRKQVREHIRDDIPKPSEKDIDRPLSIFDIMGAYNRNEDDDNDKPPPPVPKQHPEAFSVSMENNFTKEQISRSWPRLRSAPKPKDLDLLEIQDVLTRNLQVVTEMKQKYVKSEDMKEAISGLEELEEVYTLQLSSMAHIEALIKHLSHQKDMKIREMEDMIIARDMEIQKLHRELAEKKQERASTSSFTRKLSSSSAKTAPVEISKPLTPKRQLEESAVDYSDVFQLKSDQAAFSEAQQTDKDAKNVEALLNEIEERQMAEDVTPALVASRQSSIRIDVPNQTLPKLDTLKDDMLEKVAAIQVQRVYKGYKARKKFKKMNVRRMIAREILDTEVSYVRGLLMIYKIYVIPLRFKAVVGTPILSKEKLDVIFYQIREIMTLNHHLLSKIEKRVQGWNNYRKIGDLFMECSQEFHIYTHYVNNYNFALGTFNECLNTNPTFKSFLNEVKSKQEKRSLTLLDLLITPVQRIPRYILLLKELLKNTDESHPDYNDLQTAVEKIHKVGELINERKRDSEKFNQVIQLEGKLTGLPFRLAEADRRMICEGELVELTETGKKKQRHLFMFNDILVATQTTRSRFASPERVLYEYKWSVKIGEHLIGPIERHANVDKAEDEIPQFAIGIRGQERRIILAANAEDHDRWLHHFADARHSLNKSTRTMMKSKSTNSDRFVLRKAEPKADLEQKNLATIDQVIKMARDRIEVLETDVRIEAKVLYGLQRLNRVYQSSAKTKTKVSSQREESSRKLTSLQNEVERQSELLGYLEGLLKTQKKSEKRFLVDIRDCSRGLSENSQGERVVIRVYDAAKLNK